MIPSYQELMRPFLQIAYKAHNNGQVNEVKLRDVINQLAEQFNLTDEERTETLPSGKQSVLDNRVGWARTYLTKAGLLDVTRRAHFVITPRGIDALKDNVDINNEYLKRFDEFVAFKQKNNDSTETQSTTVLPAADAESDITPDEALRSAYRKINDALAEEIIERTRKVTPAFFENLLIELLLAMGYGGTGEGAAHALGKSGDNGIDGVINQDPLGVDQIYIQAKRYAKGNNVGSGDIRDFFGALNLKKAQKGIFITTSDFTPSAMQTAKDLGMRIVLINGKELAKLMLRYNIGSRDEQVLHLKKIDEEFFEA
ncbi:MULTISPECIES: restriction endonuclease [Pseudoalteromonas]|uniref:restriction endonuclease n=1 Tax=Pseudoalteromonas TaxID=53246 RepID=UPI000C3F44AE|nr:MULTISPECIES: restriction endonuclease [Pseudoalteromonas]MAY57693.1 restriction endonuclease [Pseudoalteromonas sp.]MDN3409106.1 restriction endonuclease [Pseudoalteromonas sp. APC 3894]MDN3416498.1 restriction endonuclease [Pseudoalteromonas sp. APC 3227]MDN3420195.1 restriction endonuclease [Pseudoalteromonas sp. APC 3895]MDN3423782.1 restriction endonuclease [Pseudoalteromonas sp. APC 3896]|tara:strand:+ start:1858 stop:2796 length:939 start_codon:yes stop_codon:yes gene_type:complete